MHRVYDVAAASLCPALGSTRWLIFLGHRLAFHVSVLSLSSMSGRPCFGGFVSLAREEYGFDRRDTSSWPGVFCSARRFLRSKMTCTDAALASCRSRKELGPPFWESFFRLAMMMSGFILPVECGAAEEETTHLESSDIKVKIKVKIKVSM